MTDEEILRRIQTIRRSSRGDRQACRIPTMSELARQSGITRMQIHRIANGEPIGPKSRPALIHALGCNEKGRVRT